MLVQNLNTQVVMITYSVEWDLFNWVISWVASELNNWSPSYPPDSVLICLATVLVAAAETSLQLRVLRIPCSLLSLQKNTGIDFISRSCRAVLGRIFTCPKCFLSGTLQATRALMVIGILLGLIAIFVSTVGMKCMKCLEEDEVQKMWMAVIGGVIFLVSGKGGPSSLLPSFRRSGLKSIFLRFSFLVYVRFLVLGAL